ncbi:MAG: hypothetical protein ETSY2_22395 [Candidatus Entotheonella gemina]|uniref:HTH luxR-type domain-containing protein n=1 Tax=Candidatus Entotheonella gemina TaxID=1429439 RepID=W4M5A8_9BACT|nr:MAG: hypothetical protein ETSY2_22395 [Candidatus Entotheonella gemina]
MLKASIHPTSSPVSACEDDNVLLQRIAAHDCVAFETLYTQYAPRVSSFLSRLLEHEDLIEEVRNDVMLAIWQHAGRFRQSSRLSTWIFGIARYKALYARKRSASRFMAYGASGTAAKEAIDWDHPEAITLRRESVRNLTSAVADLPQKQRLTMTLVLGQGLSYQEIATSTGCSVNTVKTRMFYARRRLAAWVDESGHGYQITSTK